MRLALVLCLVFCGCSYFKKQPQIRIGDTSVVPVPDAGRPATLDTAKAGQSIAIPAGSKFTVTKFEAVPFVPAVVGGKPQEAQPAREVVQVELAGPSIWEKRDESAHASTGTVDTTIAQKKIEAEESRILLYASIGAAVLAGLFVYLQYPTPALACGVAAVVFFLAWKISGLPSWFYSTGLVAIGVAVSLYFGHERGLRTPK